MKLGILTFHDANNYGAILQTYALQEAIKSLGHNVEIINYKQDYIINNYKPIRINYNGIFRFIRSIASTILHYHELSTKEKVFNKFRKEYLSISERLYNISSVISGYDGYISGSDQVWNLELTNFDDTFFLNFADENSLKISYAASIGSEIVNDEEKDFIKNQINNIDFISVRENSAKRIIETLTNRNIERVLDPTLLADKSIWTKFLSKYDGEDFIFVYSVGPINNLIEIAEKVSKNRGIKIVCISNKKIKNHHNIKYLERLSPIEFLTLINNAKFVVTNSFHGTAFSIIFNKNFVTLPHKKTGARMVDLLKMLKLDDRIVNNREQINKNYNLEVDYTIPKKILEYEKEKSLNFLKKALNK